MKAKAGQRNGAGKTRLRRSSIVFFFGTFLLSQAAFGLPSEITLETLLLQSKPQASVLPSGGEAANSMLNFGFNKDDQVFLRDNTKTIKQSDLTRNFASRSGRRFVSHVLRNNEILKEIVEGNVSLKFNFWTLFSLKSAEVEEQRPVYKAVKVVSEKSPTSSKKIAAAGDGFEFLEKEKVSADLFHRHNVRRTIVEEFERREVSASDELLLKEQQNSFLFPDRGYLWRTQKTFGLKTIPFSAMELKLFRKNGDAAQGLGVRLRESNDLVYVALPFGSDFKSGLAYGLKLPWKSHSVEWIQDPTQSKGKIWKLGLFQVGETFVKANYFVSDSRYALETKIVF